MPGGHFDPKPLLKLLAEIFIGRFRFVLRSFSEIPGHLRFNPHILNGYRVDYRKRDCLRSIFRLHNETFNILTHLAGSILFISLIWNTIVSLWHEAVQHTIVLVLYLVSALQCLMSSTVYHIFSCHSLCTFERLLSLDYSGITLLIFGSQVPVIFYLFYDDAFLCSFYMTGLVTISLFSHYMSHSKRYEADRYHVLRIAAFCLNALYGAICLVHVLLTKGFYHPKLWAFTQFIGLMYACYGTGVLIYSHKVPERFLPGWFDIWFHSHQIWHCLVVAAALSQYYACTSLFELFKATSPLMSITVGGS